jgi:hypothetical protein
MFQRFSCEIQEEFTLDGLLRFEDEGPTVISNTNPFLPDHTETFHKT